MTLVKTQDVHLNVSEAIKASFDSKLQEVVDQIIENSKARVETELRKCMANVVMDALSFYSVERVGGSIVITVKNRFEVEK